MYMEMILKLTTEAMRYCLLYYVMCHSQARMSIFFMATVLFFCSSMPFLIYFVMFFAVICCHGSTFKKDKNFPFIVFRLQLKVS